MRIQLWSYNYAPEPTGIAPLSTIWAGELRERGHDVRVVAAHPHYPEPRWGMRPLPYREERDGIEVLRLPLWVGRGSAGARMRQEATFAAALSLSAPTLGGADAIVAVSPSFPALLPAMVNARARRTPWVLWLQDILPDGAAATGLLDESSAVVRASRKLERAAYRSARRIVVISESFAENLREKDVPEAKLARIYNPASLPIAREPRPAPDPDAPPVVFTMGNVGHTQNLAAVVRAFEDSEDLRRLGARLVIAGDGVAGDDVRAAIRSDRVELTGVIHDPAELEARLAAATVAVVSQRYEGRDFNVPSKLMNLMGHGLAVVGSVGLDSEVARIISGAGGGWVTDSEHVEQAAEAMVTALSDPEELARRGEAARRHAAAHFDPARTVDAFEDVLRSVVAGGPGRPVP